MAEDEGLTGAEIWLDRLAIDRRLCRVGEFDEEDIAFRTASS
jgi:hypothetical protein